MMEEREEEIEVEEPTLNEVKHISRSRNAKASRGKGINIELLKCL